MNVLLDDLIRAAEREASHRKTIYKRLRVHDHVSDDYADNRIGEMVHIAQALQCLKAKGVEAIQGDCQRPAQDSEKSAIPNAHKPKTRRRNGANRQKQAGSPA